MFAALKCVDVRNYIQSGNIIFRATRQVAAEIADAIHEQIQARYGFSTPVILRTRQQIDRVARSNPFLLKGVSEDSLHVYFLSGTPDAAAVNSLDTRQSPPDRFQVCGQEIFVHLPNGMARTKLTNSYFDRKLDMISTARNWRTVLSLSQLMSPDRS